MSSAQQRLDFKIHGMDCAEEVAVLKRELGPLVGGEDRLSFDILKGRIGTKIYQPLRQALFARADLLGARPVQMSCLWRV